MLSQNWNYNSYWKYCLCESILIICLHLVFGFLKDKVWVLSLDDFSGDFHCFSLVCHVCFWWVWWCSGGLWLWYWLVLCLRGLRETEVQSWKKRMWKFINELLHEWLFAHVDVQCTIINAEYVECFWHPNTSTANYTFSSQ